MTDYTWVDPGTSGDWNVPGNWTSASGGAVPTAGDTATIGPASDGAPYTVSLTNDFDGIVDAITVAGATLAFSGQIYFNNVTLGQNGIGGDISGHGIIEGSVTQIDAGASSTIVATGGTLSIGSAGAPGVSVDTLEIGGFGNDELDLEGAGNVVQNVDFDGPSGTLYLGSGADLTVSNTLDIGSSSVLLFPSNSVPALTAQNGITIDGGQLSGSCWTTTITGSGTLSGGGALDGVVCSGAITASGGTLVIGDSGVSASQFDIADVAGSDLQFDDVASGGDVVFEGGQGTLDLTNESSPSNFADSVGGFRAGDAISLTAASDNDTVQLASDGNTLDIFDSSHTLVDAITLIGDYSGAHFALVDSNGVDTITTDAACFMAGTRIRTPDGDAAVEELKRGDLVLTADGRAEPILWVGRQTIALAFADPRRVWPIRVCAGALAANVPSRDLLLSPGHALSLDENFLVEAGALVNGLSVLREVRPPARFVYYHIELAAHGLLLAENTPAETFLDEADRLGFDNWAEREAHFSEVSPAAEMLVLRVKTSRQLPATMRARLSQRAAALAEAPAMAG